MRASVYLQPGGTVMTSKIYKLGTGKEAAKLRDLKVNFRR